MVGYVWCSHVENEGSVHYIPQMSCPLNVWREDFPVDLIAYLQVWKALHVAINIRPLLSSVLSPIELKELSTTRIWKHVTTAVAIRDRTGNFLLLSTRPHRSSACWFSARVVCMSLCPRNAWLPCHSRPQPPHLPSRRQAEVMTAQVALTVLYYFPDQECVPVLKMHGGCYTCDSCLLAWCTDTTSIEAALTLALFAFLQKYMILWKSTVPALKRVRWTVKTIGF